MSRRCPELATGVSWKRDCLGACGGLGEYLFCRLISIIIPIRIPFRLPTSLLITLQDHGTRKARSTLSGDINSTCLPAHTGLTVQPTRPTTCAPVPCKISVLPMRMEPRKVCSVHQSFVCGCFTLGSARPFTRAFTPSTHQTCS